MPEPAPPTPRQDTDNQLTQLCEFADRQGWVITFEYVNQESRAKPDQTQFRRMFSDAAQRRSDLVLVLALDRFTREGVAETFDYIKRLTANGVQFVSFTEEHFRTSVPLGN
jgi:DNA invertase Pin-like site-specific DNA recombinase